MIKRMISMILALTMILPLGTVPSFANEEVQKVEKIRIYNSADKSRHDLDVTIKNDKVYVDANQLVKLYEGEMLLTTISEDNCEMLTTAEEVNSKMSELINSKFKSKDTTFFALTNTFVNLQLIFNSEKQSWQLVDTTLPKNIEYIDLAGIDTPIMHNDKVYVELLPTARFLGAIVNVTKDKDGLIIHIPKVSRNTVIKDAQYFISGNRAFTVPLDDNAGVNTLVFFDVFLDAFSGELGDIIVGEYDANHFKNIILAMASKEVTSNYVEELWEGYDYTTDFLDTDAGLYFIDIAADGYDDYIDLLNSNPEIKEMIDNSNKTAETGLNAANAALSAIVDLYTYNSRILQLATYRVELLNNVYVENDKYMFDKSVATWGRSIEDIVKSIVEDYYDGLSGDDVLNALVKNSADLAIDSLLSSDGINALMGVTTSQVATLGSITPAAALTYCGIMLKAFEDYTGYEYGSLKEVDTIVEMQTHIRAAFHTALKDGCDSEEELKFLNNCAKLYCEMYLVYRNSLSGFANEYLEIYNRINNVNIADASMNTFSNREWLSKAKKEEMPDLVFEESFAKVDYHKLKEILGYPSGEGVHYGSMNATWDFDGDGYQEIQLKLPDDRYHCNTLWVMMDINDGNLQVLYDHPADGMCRRDKYGLYSYDYDTIFYYDKYNDNYAFRAEENIENNQINEHFYKWNGEKFINYFSALNTNDIKHDYYEIDKDYFGDNISIPKYIGDEHYENISFSYEEYKVDTSKELEEGDDIIAYYHKFMKDIEQSVKLLNKHLGVRDDRFFDEYNFANYTYFRYNQDRSILAVTSSIDVAEHLTGPVQRIYDETIYYIDTKNYKIINEKNFNQWDDSGTEWVDWEIENGFDVSNMYCPEYGYVYIY